MTAETETVVRDVRVEAAVDARLVPGRLHVPPEPSGLLCYGHGAGGAKDDDVYVLVGQLLARSTGMAALCIDGPVHGERAPSFSSEDERTRAQRRCARSRAGAEQMAVDWRAAADAALGCLATGIDSASAYVGFSMGTLFGVPTVASMPSIEAAVFFAGGLPAPGALDAPGEQDPDPEPVGDLLRETAPLLDHADVLMLNNTDDEIFDRAAILDLFSLLGARSKRLFLWAGGHEDVSPEAFAFATDFICGVRLQAGQGAPWQFASAESAAPA